MIWESWPWRRELVRTGERLRRRTRQQRWSDASFSGVERDVMIGAYAARKLLDAKTKVPQAIRDRTVPATAFRARSNSDGSSPDLMNWHQLERWFDFSHGEPTSLKPRDLCNQIIHSWVFVPVVNETTNGLDEIMVSSDRDRQRRLYSIDILELARFFIAVGNGEESSLVMSRDSTGQWVVSEVSER
jgi:hypothetical protein